MVAVLQISSGTLSPDSRHTHQDLPTFARFENYRNPSAVDMIIV
jgi:hypothetical protein